MVGLILVASLGVFAIVGPWVIPHDPNASDFSLSRDVFGAPPGPSTAHWLGTDAIYRDLLARLAHGARISLAIALLATVMSTTMGALVGVTAGVLANGRARIVDSALMRLVDVLLALPFLLFVTAIGAAVGRADIGTILLVLGLTSWAGTARLVRAKALQIRELDFVTAARALGAGPARVVWRHILPNVAGTLIVVATMSVAQMILAEAVLGYLTVGIQPPRATWGRMLHEAEHFLGTRLSLIAAPGFAILLAVLGWNRVGEGLRDALDPRGSAGLPPPRRVPVDLLIAGAILLLIAVAKPSEVRPPIGEEPQASEPARGGVLRVGTSVNVRTLDPALAYDEAALPIEELIYARLVTWDDKGSIAPDLAGEFHASPDGLVHTFVLREGLRFQDGSELIAADVKRSIERTLHPKTPSPGAGSYASIDGFEAFHSGKASDLSGVRVDGRRTVVITLREPDATFLPLMTLAFMAPVCSSSGAFADAKSPAHPCGAGPFRVATWEPDRSIRLARHEAYYKPGRPYLDGVEWLLNVRWSTQRYKFEDGELDYTRELTGADAALYRAHPAWRERARWSVKQATYALFLNTEMPPFHDRAMRRAVAHAVDPSVLDTINPILAPTDRVLPASIPGPDRSTPMRRFDPAAALEELSRAGYAYDPKTREGGYPRAIDLVTTPGGLEQQVAEVFQQQLAAVGIRVRLRLVSFPTYLAEISRRRTTTMGTTGWNADFPDASNFFEPTLSSRAIQDEGSQNYAFFSNAELDKVLAEARAEQDRDRRFALYAKAEAIVRDEAPWVPSYGVRTFELWQPYMQGYAPHPIIAQRFSDTWLDPAARAHARRSGASGTSMLARLGLGPFDQAGAWSGSRRPE
jgi:ABC-type dipeptide/oligopeptide/nickel transport system permease subunit/ABC-type transport system substrate-binding protein